MSPPAEPAACPRCGVVLAAIGGECPGCLAGHLLAVLKPPAAPSDGMPALPGWRLTEVLGAGGMGRVYRAENEADGSLAAVKILDRRWALNPVMVARFESEAETLRRLEHPNIVRLLQTGGTEDDQLCLIMEYVEGCDLGRLLRAQPLPPERAAAIFRQICAAVAHAHARGFIHRDIKPSNILIGTSAEAKLADFGLARDTTQADGAIGGLTATTDQFGTAYYLAPERMLPGRTATAQADVYSLGVLLYHLFSSRMPLGKFTPLSKLTSLPPALDALISGALEADPGRRTGSVEALSGGFEKIWKSHLANTSRRRLLRRIGAAAMAAMVLGLTLAAGAWWQRRHAGPPRADFRPPTTAAREHPWENSLGMKFVPVPGTNVLFSIWETRVADAQSYVDLQRGMFDEPWQQQVKIKRLKNFQNSISTHAGVAVDGEGFLPQPSNPHAPIGLIFGVESQNFCRWLTWREQVEGRLALHQYYRLPTSEEWRTAARGVAAEISQGNFAGPESAGQPWLLGGSTIGTADAFAGAAPVGSFAPSADGLFDLSGNVSEWVRDPKPRAKGDPDTMPELALWNYQLCGSSFADGSVISGVRQKLKQRHPWIGCRLVLEYRPPEEESPDFP
jgi:serine/threonine protein kinase